MHLESSDGHRANVTESQLARLLERPAPLLHLHGRGIALVAMHAQGTRYTLMHWNGRVWRRTTTDLDESSLAPRFIQFLNDDDTWPTGLAWEPVRRAPGASATSALSAGLHVFVSFLLIFGGFTVGVALGFVLGRKFDTHADTLVYVLAVLFAAPLAMLGQYAAARIPSACTHCGECAINLQIGRFAYLCTECGHLNITRWGIHRGPMAP
jgi:predicted RNA-binding Zn-ribbon protein involved in translation (DUF1610 family)